MVIVWVHNDELKVESLLFVKRKKTEIEISQNLRKSTSEFVYCYNLVHKNDLYWQEQTTRRVID